MSTLDSYSGRTHPNVAADAPRPYDGPTAAATAAGLRICHVAYTFYESDNRVLRYAETLAADGAEVEVIALRRAGQNRTERVRGVEVCRVQPRQKTEKRQATYFLKIMLFLFRAGAIVTARHLRRPYDVIHVHNLPDFLVFAALVPRLAGARIILDIHDILPELYAEKFGRRSDSLTFKLLLLVERLSCRFAHHVIVANDIWHARIAKRAADAAKCSALINYPDLRLFKPRGQPRREGNYVLLFPGTLSYHQGVDVAIRAFKLACDRMPNAEFQIYGDGPARKDLERLVSELQLQTRVKFMDPVPIDKIAAVMSGADLGVEPKRSEGFGNEALSTKILEFMACGVPVVVSRTAGHEYYFDGDLVRFFEPGVDVDLAAAMVESYERRAALDQRLEEARQFAVSQSWQHHVCDYRRIVSALTNERAH